jgi:hypothetical protein
VITSLGTSSPKPQEETFVTDYKSQQEWDTGLDDRVIETTCCRTSRIYQPYFAQRKFSVLVLLHHLTPVKDIGLIALQNRDQLRPQSQAIWPSFAVPAFEQELLACRLASD